MLAASQRRRRAVASRDTLRDAAEAYASYALWCGEDGAYDNVRMVMQKDMKLARDMAASTSGSYPALDQILQIFDGLDEVTQANWRVVGDASPCPAGVPGDVETTTTKPP